jgi:hypothetical protein
MRQACSNVSASIVSQNLENLRFCGQAKGLGICARQLLR